MEKQQYIDYIKECRKRGFKDDVIKNSLEEKGWPIEEINEAFDSIDKKQVKGKQVKKDDSKKVKKDITTEESSKEDDYYKNMIDIKKGSYTPDEEEEEPYDTGEQIYKGKYTQEVYGSSVTLFLDDELRTALQKRAKKNMFNLQEQIEDILRRSVLNLKGKRSLPDEKLDDKLVGIFSRRNTGQKTKKKKVKKEKKSTKKLTKEQEKRNKRRSKSLKKHYRKDRIKAKKEKRVKKKQAKKNNKKSKKK